MAVKNRELIIEIGPFEEWKGAIADSPLCTRIISNGNRGTLKASVHCQKNIVSYPNNAEIRIWNLSRKTRESFKKTGLYVKVLAGYEGMGHEVLFSGSLEATTIKRSGADIITTLTCMTGGSAFAMSTFTKTYEQGVPVSFIVEEMAREIPGIIVDPLNITVSGTIGYKGFSYTGSTVNGLRKLADQFGFSWSIDNGVFVAIDDLSYRRTSISLSRDSGLIEVSPRMFGINQIQEGVDVSCIYTQGIEAGHTIRVESQVSPDLTGEYMCHTIEYDLSPKENSWNMTINCFSQEFLL